MKHNIDCSVCTTKSALELRFPLFPARFRSQRGHFELGKSSSAPNTALLIPTEKLRNEWFLNSIGSPFKCVPLESKRFPRKTRCIGLPRSHFSS